MRTQEAMVDDKLGWSIQRTLTHFNTISTPAHQLLDIDEHAIRIRDDWDRPWFELKYGLFDIVYGWCL